MSRFIDRSLVSCARLLIGAALLLTGCNTAAAPIAAAPAAPAPPAVAPPAMEVAWNGPKVAPYEANAERARPIPIVYQTTSPKKKAPPAESEAHAPHAADHPHDTPAKTAHDSPAAPAVPAAAPDPHAVPAADPHAAPATAAAHDPHAAVDGLSPADSLAKLKTGNDRFVAGKPEHPDQSVARRSEVAKGQHPYAIILSCSDSRVPPELVFDAGLGDLFVVRVAGNTADESAIGSIEYAVEHLGATLIVVLGHERCGAVKAAVDSADATAPAPGHLPAVLEPIAPAVKQVKNFPGDTVDFAVRANVANTVEQLKTSDPVLSERLKSGKLQIVGGRYDLETGAVELK